MRLLSTYNSGGSVQNCIEKYSPEELILFTGELHEESAQLFISKFELQAQVVLINPFHIEELFVAAVNIGMDNSIFNITEGTNAMASALLLAAYFTGHSAVYSARDTIIELPVPNVPYRERLSERELHWLKKIYQATRTPERFVSQSDLARGLPAQTFTRQLKAIENLGLITRTVQGTTRHIRLTHMGELYTSVLFTRT
jgi:hypothetical protein